MARAERDRGQVGREGRPGAVLDLRDRVAEVGLDPQLLPGGDEHVPAVHLRVQAEAAELAAHHQQVERLDVADAQVSPGRRGEGHEAADLDVIGGDRVLGAAESRSRPCTVITLEPMPSTWAPIVQSSRARSCTCGSQAALEIVVGPGVSAAAISAFSVPITEGSSMKIAAGAETPGGGAELDPAIAVDPGAEVVEGVEVGVEAATADEIAAGRRHPRLAEAGEQRPGEEEGGADLFGELLVDGHIGDPLGAEPHAVVGDPGDLDAEALEQSDLRFGVANARHPVQQQLLLGEQAGGEDRQRRVLVAGDGHLAGERHPALDDEFLHS